MADDKIPYDTSSTWDPNAYGSISFPTCVTDLMIKNAKDTLYSLNDLQAMVRRRCFPFVPDLYSLLGMTPNGDRTDGLQNFADIIKESLQEFQEYDSRIVDARIENIENGKFVFVDNFFDYIDTKIPFDKTYIKPRTIIHFTNMFGFYSSVKTSNYFRYEQTSGAFECTWSTIRVKYFIDYPYRAILNEAHTGFTEDSGAYLISDRDQFEHIVCLHVMNRIAEYSEMIQLPGFVINLNFQTQKARLEESVANDRARSSALYAKWGL